MTEKKDVDCWIAALKDSDSRVRNNAAAALGTLGDMRAVPPLILALSDKYNLVREKAKYP